MKEQLRQNVIERVGLVANYIGVLADLCNAKRGTNPVFLRDAGIQFSGNYVYLPAFETVSVRVKLDDSGNKSVQMQTALSNMSMAAFATYFGADALDEVLQKLNQMADKLLVDNDEKLDEIISAVRSELGFNVSNGYNP